MQRSPHYHVNTPLRIGECYYPEAHLQTFCTPQYAMVYVSQGEAVYEDIAGNTYRIHPGQMFQRFPDQKHTVHYVPDTRTHFAALPVEIYRLMLDSQLPTLDQVVLSPGARCGFEHRQQRLTTQLQMEHPQKIMRTLTQVQQLIIDMHLKCMENCGDESNLVDKACRMLGTDFSVSLSPQNVAQELRISYSYFRKIFKQSTGISPGQYRLQKRLEKAREMILLGRGIGEIAQQLGYSDIYAFSAQFKKHCGISPSRYRNDYLF